MVVYSPLRRPYFLWGRWHCGYSRLMNVHEANPTNLHFTLGFQCLGRAQVFFYLRVFILYEFVNHHPREHPKRTLIYPWMPWNSSEAFVCTSKFMYGTAVSEIQCKYPTTLRLPNTLGDIWTPKTYPKDLQQRIHRGGSERQSWWKSSIMPIQRATSSLTPCEGGGPFEFV